MSITTYVDSISGRTGDNLQYLQQTLDKHSVRPGEIVFEVDNERIDRKEENIVDDLDPYNPTKMRIRVRTAVCGNCHELFPPVDGRPNSPKQQNFIRTRRVLMRDGAITRFNMDASLADVDYIAGERIHVDIERRIGRITDGIFDRENEEHRRQMYEAFGKRTSFKGLFVPSEPVETELKSDQALWNWLFWMRRIADGDGEHNGGPPQHPGCSTKGPRRCRPVQNMDLLPSFEQCVRSLKVTLGLPPMTEERRKSFQEETRAADTANRFFDSKRGEIILSPYLCGLPESV